jgi:hypothetical protein
MKYTAFATLLFVAIFSSVAKAQTGSINGRVFDRQTGEELIGANVLMVGTTMGANTDIDGKFTVRNIPVGTYSVRISFVGYVAQVVSDVQVAAGQDFKLDIALAQEAFEQEEVVVTAERVLSSEASVLAERKKSAVIGDAISAEQIKRAPDATSGDALKRVTGLTVVSDKFVFIRGVTDRYNGTSLNGVNVTSTDTEVDRKSFSFDLVPSSLLENAVVVKTATPDLPGDFSGGLVQVNTLDFPTTRVARLGFRTTYNSIATTKSILRSQGGGTDWLGIDDGSREFPSGAANGTELAQRLPNTWAPRTARAPLDASFNLSLGDRMGVGEKNEFGYVAAFSYSNSFERDQFRVAPTYVDGATPQFVFDGTRSQYSVLWSGLLDLSLKLSGLHKISLKNSYNQAGDDKLYDFAGVNIPGNDARRQSTSWDQRSLYMVQLTGSHLFPALANLDLEWKAFSSTSDATEPDRKQVEYTKSSGPYYILGENYRTWSTLGEKTRGGRLDLTFPLFEAKLKGGTLIEDRSRDFDIQAYSTDPSYLSAPNRPLVIQPIDSIFRGENYGPGKFVFIPTSTFSGKYDGSQNLNAYYLMLDIPFELFAQSFRLVGGARLENSRIRVTSPKAIDDPTIITSNLNKIDLLPSINLTYIVNDFTNVRLAHYQSVNRPELRELAGVLYLDFNQDRNVIGNSSLQRAYVHNYDLRVELFPGIGEVVAGSFFYKSLYNAIEERLIVAPDRYVQTWYNSPSGKNYGIELEARKTLGFLGDYFRTMMVTGNYTWITSEIEYTEERTDPQGNPVITQAFRPMQGQSPWTINLGLIWSDPDLGTSASILYNKFGRRLAAVGDQRDQDVYEEPRDLVDLSLTQRLSSLLELRFTMKNVFADEIRFTSGPEEVFYARYEDGREYALGLSLNL